MPVKSVVAISGAAGGLGPTVTRVFHQGGSALALCGRSAAKLAALLDSIGVPADARLATAADLVDPAAATAWAREIQARFGRVDAVLHLVGGYAAGTSISEIQPDAWQELQTRLVRTTLHVARAFAAPLKASRGRFIGVTSPKAQAPTAKSALYAMAKAASDALVLALADELRGSGATANLIVVDSIDAPESRDDASKRPYGKSTPAEQIAEAMRFLCTQEAASINGARIPLIGRDA